MKYYTKDSLEFLFSFIHSNVLTTSNGLPPGHKKDPRASAGGFKIHYFISCFSMPYFTSLPKYIVLPLQTPEAKQMHAHNVHIYTHTQSKLLMFGLFR